MTAATLILGLCHHGAVFSIVDGRLRIEAPRGVLTADLHAVLSHRKGEILRLLQLSSGFRRVLRHGFGLIAKAAAADLVECERFLAEHARLANDLGANLATAIREDTAEQWHAQTGRCPLCGELGERHHAEVGL